MQEAKVGLYLRLSREDEDCENESQSITNQRAYLEQYAQAQSLTVIDTYVDDGYSGTTFDRPEFIRMIGDIEAKRINTVITKDLSRLGRDYIQVGHYLQRYFPERGVRYLALADQYDSAVSGGINVMMPFLSVFNDMYAQDISKKVRTALDTRKAQGKFIGSSAPFGYQKSEEDKGLLVIDPVAGIYVQNLFWCYLQCASVTGTAKWLTEQGIPTPSEYKKAGCAQVRFPGVWSDTMVRRILTNPTYAGHLTQNRSRKVGYKVDKKFNLPQEEWITVPDTHEGIIAPEVFVQVQGVLTVRSHTPETGEGHLLTGLAFCADCGAPMTYVRESETRTYMVCQGYRRGGRLRLCTPHCMREAFVIAAIQQQLQRLAQRLDVEALEQSVIWDGGKSQAQRQMDALQRRLEANKKMAQSLYRDKAAETIHEREFWELFDGVRQERQRLETSIQALTTHLTQENAQEQIWQQLRAIIGFQALDRRILAALIDKVLIYENKEIEIMFQFQKPEWE